MNKQKRRAKVLHVYMTDEEYAFLQVCADQLGMSLAQALLHLADFENRHREYLDSKHPENLSAINFSQTPLQDSEEY